MKYIYYLIFIFVVLYIFFNTKNNDNIKFAIVMATFHRNNNKSIEYLNRSLNSIINQEYNNWTLIIIGDKYEPENELLEIIDKFKSKTTNEIIYLKNEIVERDYIFDKNKLWMSAGARSINMGIKYAKDNNYKYYCHLDDDDHWTSTHLLHLAEIYNKYSNCIFANTKSTHINDFLPSEDMEIYENNRLPIPGGTIHSSFSFRLDIIPFYYNTIFDISTSSNFFDENAVTAPVDAVMLSNIQNFLNNNKQYCSIYIPKLTCYHDTERETVT